MSPKPRLDIRHPPSQSSAAKRFITEGVATDVSGRLQTSDLPKHSQTLGVVQRKNGRQRRRMTLYFDPEIAAQLTAYCATEGRELSHFVNEAVRRRLPQKRLQTA